MQTTLQQVLDLGSDALDGATSSEKSLAALVLVLVGGWVLARLFRGWFQQAVKPDPWGPQVTADLASPEAQPLCTSCLQPHAGGDWFCRHCGAATGDFNNVSPYLYIFSVGEMLRSGTSGCFRPRGIALLGFVLVSLEQYTVFAPLYWVQLFLNLRRQRRAAATPAPPAAEEEPDQAG